MDHLTSFGSGFLPEPNAIDFAFIFTRVSFSDHMTIFILLIIYFIVYFSGMIWATLKDKKDLEAVSSPTRLGQPLNFVRVHRYSTFFENN